MRKNKKGQTTRQTDRQTNIPAIETSSQQHASLNRHGRELQPPLDTVTQRIDVRYIRLFVVDRQLARRRHRNADAVQLQGGCDRGASDRQKHSVKHVRLAVNAVFSVGDTNATVLGNQTDRQTNTTNGVLDSLHRMRIPKTTQNHRQTVRRTDVQARGHKPWYGRLQEMNTRRLYVCRHTRRHVLIELTQNLRPHHQRDITAEPLLKNRSFLHTNLTKLNKKKNKFVPSRTRRIPPQCTKRQSRVSCPGMLFWKCRRLCTARVVGDAGVARAATHGDDSGVRSRCAQWRKRERVRYMGMRGKQKMNRL